MSDSSRPSSAFDGRVPYPEFASIETTMKCNLQCPMCLPFLDGSTVNGSHMDLEDFESIARSVFPYVDSFQLTISGEPLMTKGLGRMLELAEEYGVRTEYYTNGTLLNDRMIAMILPTLGQICISFDGATKDTFEFMRKGASFEHVLRNLERLAAEIGALGESSRPTVGLAVTVMEKNVRELPALVELAHRLKLDFVSIAHVLPVVPEMQRQSLYHDVDLAKEWIDAALRRGSDLGVNVVVAPLDQVIAAMAETDRPTGTTDRARASADGVVDGLGERAVNQTRRRARLGPVTTEASRKHVASRPEKRRRADVLGVPAGEAPPPRPDSIWYCDFLWNRIYVTSDATVRPCCVPGVPDIADFRHGGIEEVWDNDAYRAMRIGLVRKEPVPVCRGCGAIKELTDPAEIDRALQGRSLPERMPLPPVLLPVVEAADLVIAGTRDRPVAAGLAPPVTWPAVDGTLAYEFEASCEQKDKSPLRFDTTHRGIALAEPRFAIPAWMWEKAEVGSRIEWRAIARIEDVRRIVARGCLRKVHPWELPVVGGDRVESGAVVHSVRAPTVAWPRAAAAAAHAFEASLDGFATVHYTTLDGDRVLADPSFDVPDALWGKVPRGATCSWRGVLVHPDRREVVARGAFVRDA